MDIWQVADIEVEPHQPVVLHSDEGAARVVVVELSAGDALGDHEVHEHAWLHVVRGSVVVEAGEGQVDAPAGTLVHWSPQERHAVRAADDARLVLLLAPWPGSGHPRLRHG